MVVDGIAKFQTLKFPVKSLVLLVRRRIPHKFQALKSKIQGLKFGESIHHRSIPHLLPAKKTSTLGQRPPKEVEDCALVFGPIHFLSLPGLWLAGL